MALALGFAALFFGAAMVIVGIHGGGIRNMNSNMIAMLEGKWLPDGGSTTSAATSGGGNASSGGVYAPPPSAHNPGPSNQ